MDDDDFDEKPTPEPNARAPLTLSDSVSRRRRGPPYGVPQTTEALELLLGRQLAAEDHAQIDALRKSDAVDPYLLAVNLANVLVAQRKDQKSGSEETARAVASAVKDQDDRLKSIEKRVKLADRILWVAALAVVGSLVAAADRIWSRSAHETEIEFRLRAVEHERAPREPAERP